MMDSFFCLRYRNLPRLFGDGYDAGIWGEHSGFVVLWRQRSCAGLNWVQLAEGFFKDGNKNKNDIKTRAQSQK